MLYYAAAMGGESATSIQAAKDLAKLNRNTAMLSLALVRFGRFDEILAITEAPNGVINTGMYDFAQGYAALKFEDITKAQETVDSLWELTKTTTARFRFHDGKDILGTMAGILEGEIAWAGGNMEAALEAFQTAAEYYDNLNYDEPEPLPFSPRHWQGAAYLEIAEYEKAAATYRRDLEDHPHNFWALFGIQRSLEKLGQYDSIFDEDFIQASENADIWLSSTKF
jgi:tetratricopeptide (TPR) repeat protein|tara:strand:- start:4890 stop:5564 length:675 start_codon:yes stop_codon:yes gene_type:complete